MLFASALLAISSADAADPPPPADLVLLNGTIVTVDPDRPQVQALAARGEKIVALGTAADLAPLVGPRTRAIDLKGRLAIPGFIEGHGHLTGLGEARLSLDLGQARSWDDVVALVAARAKQTPVGEWIIGDGWHQGRWDNPPKPAVEGYPVHQALSRETPHHPVLLKHSTGHMCFANLRAMQLAGIDRTSPDAAGGKILRDKAGDATGAFREEAQNAIYSAWGKFRARLSPQQRETQTLRGIELAVDECLAKGVTSFQDAGSSFATIGLFKRLAESNRLKLRLWVMVRGESLERLRDL
ncbi:MAG TPA: amidohydrolase family protein, partial [Planctomycetaceae bacterium]